MLKTITQTEEEYVAKASKHPNIQTATEKEHKKEKTKSEANFPATIRIESNNGAKAGGKKTLALPTDFFYSK